MNMRDYSTLQLVDVNEHERLFNITIRPKFKYRNSAFILGLI
jgi:hypothetical protein